MLKLLLGVMPYLSGKGEQAAIVADFCRRTTAYDHIGRAVRSGRGATRYTSEDIEAVNKIRHLNFRGDPKYLTGFPKLLSLKPNIWQGNGVLVSDYRTAVRTFQPDYRPGVVTVENSANPNESSSTQD